MIPAAPQHLVFPEEEFRARAPAAAALRPFQIPPVRAFTLANGIAVYLVEQHALPLVSLDLNFDGGAAVDPPGKDGLASVCMAMLSEGTVALDKLAYAERLADTASSIGGYAGDDSVGLTLSSLRKHLAPTFAQFVDTLRAPGFRGSDFERMIRRRIEGIKQSRGNPSSVAGRVSGPVLYGPDHPFGAVVTEASLAALTLEDCRAFADTWLRPAGARLFVVGDVTEADVRAWFAAPELADWTGAAPAPPELPAPRAMPGRIFLVDLPGASQSTVSYLQFASRRTDPGYFATALLGAVFGGGFTSRLNMNLREDKGYSYGARGGFSYTKTYGALTATTPVAGGATYQTILEIDRELRDLARAVRPVRDDELEREKRGAILGLPGRFATAQAALGQYRGLVYFGLPLDEHDRYAERIAEVSPAQVMAAARAQLRPEEAVYVVVGDASAPSMLRVRDGNSPSGWVDAPFLVGDNQLTLREALAALVARGDVGGGGLVELDADARVVVG